ncbi:hypothetical protein P608_09720 [Comamonas thiooxydans]|uniref:Uncharacterized protein n=2 Tax=Comamonas TaxID=283 RepID=A0A0E3BVH4_9BURK|nr:hypothetical protein O987_22295 [Comamonas testosteroni TK102]KGG91649.1 hypothetical protein P245_13680 [Comamonas thiooxydans]KGH12908.1 hypothetical protein P608_09720 [Comamonas thiooxydans]KGH24009.1 hypothetical protein P606_09935 [Comamonas thiooxydans]KGH25637.1 hypothetical protein P607_05310 [Comamonas thiooxydans]
MIFARWSIDGPSFEECLSDAKFYYDTMWCRTTSGMEVLGPSQRFIFKASWKTAAEQGACDGYYMLILHRRSGGSPMPRRTGPT